MDDLNAENDRLSYELEQYLILSGASDYLHYFLRFNYDLVRRGQIIILAPKDVALQRLVDRAGKSLDVISVTVEGKEILSNFLSSRPIQLDVPVYTAINGAYLKTENDLVRLKRTSHVQLGNLTVGTIDGIINMPGQLDRLKQVNPRNLVIQPKNNIIGDNPVTDFDDFPNPIVRKIALELSLSDIVNNCRTSSVFNSVLCDNETFWQEKVRMDFPEQEFIINIDWKNTYRALSKKLYTFGRGEDGKLGHGDEKIQHLPKSVEGLSNVTFVACGRNHTAAITGGRLYTFGTGLFGQLGNGEQQKRNRPILVEGLDNVTYVACGNEDTAAISNGQLYTFGLEMGTRGQLGHGDDLNLVRPKLVEGLDNVTVVACGQSHTAAISNNRLYTFGRGASGQLGHGDQQDQSRPKLVEGLDNVTFVACGGANTAVISNGRLYTFGSGHAGQLGHGNKLNQLRPKLVEKSYIGNELTNVTFVACGAAHTAVISDGQLYTFGSGIWGILGHDNRDEQLRPKLVNQLNGVVTYAACSFGFTAVVAGNRLYTFGQGELGIGETQSWTPALVGGLEFVTMVSCGENHIAALAL